MLLTYHKPPNSFIFFSSVRKTSIPYWATHCSCLIQDIRCKECSNKLGYTVLIPCATCLETESNGHLWVFRDCSVIAVPRLRRHSNIQLTQGDMHCLRDTPAEVEEIKRDIAAQEHKH